MGSSTKRRSSERKRSHKASMPSVFEIGPKGWGDEVLSVGFFALSLFLSIALISFQYHLHLTQNDEVLSEPLKVANLMGPVGNTIASVLSSNMGWCSFVPVLWLLWLGKHFWHYQERKISLKVSSRFFLFLALIALLLFTCIGAAIIDGREAGGRIGAYVAEPMQRLFNLWGASLITTVGLLLSMAVISQKNVASLVYSIFTHALVVSSLVFLTLPTLVFRTLHLALSGAFAALSSIWAAVLRASGSSLSSEITSREKIALPPPRRRKNEIQKVEDLEQDNEDSQDDEDEQEEVFSHVVVSRKKSDYKLQPAESKSLRKRVEKVSDNIEREVQEYIKPDINFLTKGEEGVVSENDEELIQTSKQIEAKLKDFNILGRVTEVHPGPVITLYEFEPAAGVKVGRISALQDDLAMSLRAVSIRIIAPIPKRGTVGIEVPNRNREIVRLRDVLESNAFMTADSCLSVPIGKDTYGEPVVVDIASMPHLLMAGTTGTGKSVSINALLVSLLYRATPQQLGLILIDPKILELSIYEGIPHLRVPVVTNARQAKAVLDWAAKEMERRYRLMQKYGVRNIDGYNRIVSGEDPSESGKEEKLKKDPSIVQLTEDEVVESGTVDKAEKDMETVCREAAEIHFAEKLQPLPKLVIVIDELADLMLAVGRDIEELITRLAQKARAAGIHLILATQRPSVDVITGLIKANFPARLSFRVSSRIDSRTILDSMGAEKLLGRGDMLFQAPGSVHLKRVHGAFVSDNEVKKVVEYLKKNSTPQYDENIIQICERALEEEQSSKGGEGVDEIDGGYDAFYDKAVELVVQKGQASTSMVQRTFRIGYNRAARIIEMMEREGIIGPMDGVKPRDVLIQTPIEMDDKF